MSIILTLKNEAGRAYHDNITVSSEFDEDATWPEIAKMFFRQLKALGYSFCPEKVRKEIEEFIQNGEFE